MVWKCEAPRIVSSPDPEVVAYDCQNGDIDLKSAALMAYLTAVVNEQLKATVRQYRSGNTFGIDIFDAARCWKTGIIKGLKADGTYQTVSISQ